MAQPEGSASVGFISELAMTGGNVLCVYQGKIQARSMGKRSRLETLTVINASLKRESTRIKLFPRRKVQKVEQMANKEVLGGTGFVKWHERTV